MIWGRSSVWLEEYNVSDKCGDPKSGDIVRPDWKGLECPLGAGADVCCFLPMLEEGKGMSV